MATASVTLSFLTFNNSVDFGPGTVSVTIFGKLVLSDIFSPPLSISFNVFQLITLRINFLNELLGQRHIGIGDQALLVG